MITALEVFIERRARLGAAGADDAADDSAGAAIVTQPQRRNARTKTKARLSVSKNAKRNGAGKREAAGAIGFTA
jgi:hypothetical protein